MNKTHLHENHIELGAKMVDFAGWEMPIQYNNLKEEVLAVRNDVGVFDVSHMGEFFVKGPDATKFVDYLMTNDYTGAEMGKAVYSPLCREDGTVIDDFIAYKLAEDFALLCVNASNIEKDFKWINSKKENFEVEVINKSDEFSLLAVQGPNSFKTLKEIEITKSLKNINYYSVQVEESEQGLIIFARTGYTGEDGFEVFGPHAFIKKLWSELINKNVRACGLGARDVLRLEVCYPLYGHEIDDSVTPLDAGLKWTVKLQKDSFIGKEALGNYQPKFQLLKLTVDKGIPREGYEILNSKEETIGFVTSGTMSVVANQGIALARVNKDLFTSGENLFVKIRNRILPCNINKKPFVIGGHK